MPCTTSCRWPSASCDTSAPPSSWPPWALLVKWWPAICCSCRRAVIHGSPACCARRGCWRRVAGTPRARCPTCGARSRSARQVWIACGCCGSSAMPKRAWTRRLPPSACARSTIDSRIRCSGRWPPMGLRGRCCGRVRPRKRSPWRSAPWQSSRGHTTINGGRSRRSSSTRSSSAAPGCRTALEAGAGARRRHP